LLGALERGLPALATLTLWVSALWTRLRDAGASTVALPYLV